MRLWGVWRREWRQALVCVALCCCPGGSRLQQLGDILGMSQLEVNAVHTDLWPSRPTSHKWAGLCDTLSCLKATCLLCGLRD
jgi:hypothetical protein